MNEAFFDMAGAAAEGYVKESDWLNGHDATKVMVAYRYFEDPTMDGHSRGSMKEYCPRINVHYSSGVYNRVFFILSTSPGWNIRIAFHVFATANQLYWTENTAFNDGACAVIQAAEDLGFAAEDVRNAFVEVGINPCGPAKEGVHALHDIRALANETLQSVFELEDDNTSVLRFEIFSWKPRVTFESYTVRVDTPVRSLFFDESFEGLHVINPEPGQYVVTLEFSKPVLLSTCMQYPEPKCWWMNLVFTPMVFTMWPMVLFCCLKYRSQGCISKILGHNRETGRPHQRKRGGSMKISTP